MYLITYDTTLYYFTFHISKIDLWIRITFFIQNDFSNKLTINIWMRLSIFIWNTLIIYKLIHHCHKNPSYFSRMNNSEKFVNHVKISKKRKRNWNLTQLEFELEISHDLFLSDMARRFHQSQRIRKNQNKLKGGKWKRGQN